MRRLVALFIFVFCRARADAQQYGAGTVLLQGVADGEFWSTNATSNLLTRNGGRPTGLARLQVWGAYQPFGGLVAYAQSDFEAGPARGESGSELYLDQVGVRYV